MEEEVKVEQEEKIDQIQESQQNTNIAEIDAYKYELYNNLIKSIYNIDTQLLNDTINNMMKYCCLQSLINIQDQKGNTPLMLNVKLNYISPSAQLDICLILLKAGANPSISDQQDETPFYEAICQKNGKMAFCIYNSMGKKCFLEREKQTKMGMDAKINKIQNFYIEMNYKIDNNYIPLVQHIVPSDTIKIWKVGDKIRSEQTFAGYDQTSKMKKILRKQTNFIYNPDMEELKKDLFYEQVVITCPQHQIYSFPTYTMTSQQYVINLIRYRRRLEKRMEKDKKYTPGFLLIDKVNHQKSKSFFGKEIRKQINGYDTIRHDLKIQHHRVNIKQNNGCFNIPYSQYCQEYRQSNKYAMFEKTGKYQEIKSETKLDEKYMAEKQQEKGGLQLWMASDFPLNFQDFNLILNFLLDSQQKQNQGEDNGQQEHPVMKNLQQLFQNEDLLKLFDEQGFPVKIQVPLMYNFFADINFQNFRKIESMDQESIKYPELFKIPKDYNKKFWREAVEIINETFGQRLKAHYNQQIEEEQQMYQKMIKELDDEKKIPQPEEFDEIINQTQIQEQEIISSSQSSSLIKKQQQQHQQLFQQQSSSLKNSNNYINNNNSGSFINKKESYNNNIFTSNNSQYSENVNNQLEDENNKENNMINYQQLLMNNNNQNSYNLSMNNSNTLNNPNMDKQSLQSNNNSNQNKLFNSPVKQNNNNEQISQQQQQQQYSSNIKQDELEQKEEFKEQIIIMAQKGGEEPLLQQQNTSLKQCQKQNQNTEYNNSNILSNRKPTRNLSYLNIQGDVVSDHDQLLEFI